jgi:hypothetical protein
VSVFTLVPLKTLKFGTMRNILNVRWTPSLVSYMNLISI